MLQVQPGHCQLKHPPPVLEVLGQEQVLLGLQAGKLGVQVPLALVQLLKCKNNQTTFRKKQTTASLFTYLQHLENSTENMPHIDTNNRKKPTQIPSVQLLIFS